MHPFVPILTNREHKQCKQSNMHAFPLSWFTILFIIAHGTANFPFHMLHAIRLPFIQIEIGANLTSAHKIKRLNSLAACGAHVTHSFNSIGNIYTVSRCVQQFLCSPQMTLTPDTPASSELWMQAMAHVGDSSLFMRPMKERHVLRPENGTFPLNGERALLHLFKSNPIASRTSFRDQVSIRLYGRVRCGEAEV